VLSLQRRSRRLDQLQLHVPLSEQQPASLESDDRAGSLVMSALVHRRVVFLIGPTGPYCREDRCQSYFGVELVPSMRPPLEECEAAGALKAAGAEAFLIDAPAARLTEAETLDRLRTIAPDLVVLVVTFGTLPQDLAWAGRVRAVLPEVTIGVRGAPCYAQAETILQDAPDVEFCVRGEYELIFAAIARHGFRAAGGTVWRDEDRCLQSPPAHFAADLDALPWPDRSVLDPRLYTVRGIGRPQATVRVQRGCPFPCTYCLVHTVSGAQARHRSPASVAAEMAAVQRSGTDFFYLRADTFSLDRHWAVETCKAIAERCPRARWVTTTRVECVDDEVLQAMRHAGCYGVSFGIDVGSRVIGERVRKRPDRKLASAAMRLCDRHGIVSLGYFMIGFLWESPQTLAETADFLHAVRPDLLTIHFAHPYPGTRYYEEVAAQQAAIVSPRAQAEPALDLGGVSPRVLRRAARAMTIRHYIRPAVIASVARKMSAQGWSLLRRRPNGPGLAEASPLGLHAAPR
jgi:anaerobic magnesium-protoporphyrin IX monomethyl ester cyclase